MSDLACTAAGVLRSGGTRWPKACRMTVTKRPARLAHSGLSEGAPAPRTPRSSAITAVPRATWAGESTPRGILSRSTSKDFMECRIMSWFVRKTGRGREQQQGEGQRRRRLSTHSSHSGHCIQWCTHVGHDCHQRPRGQAPRAPPPSERRTSSNIRPINWSVGSSSADWHTTTTRTLAMKRAAPSASRRASSTSSAAPPSARTLPGAPRAGSPPSGGRHTRRNGLAHAAPAAASVVAGLRRAWPASPTRPQCWNVPNVGGGAPPSSRSPPSLPLPPALVAASAAAAGGRGRRRRPRPRHLQAAKLVAGVPRA